MKSHLPEKLYLASPVWAQNALVSIYGALEHKRRYGGPHKSYIEHLRNNVTLDEKQVANLQEKLLERILSDAIKTVPAYQALKLGASPRLSDFPLLDREPIAINPDNFVSNRFNKKQLLCLYTGGSSANPLKVYISDETRQKSYSFWQLFYDRMKFKVGDRKATLVGRKIQEPDNDSPPFWRYNLKDRQLLFSSYHLTECNIPTYIKKLNAFKPKIIEGYPLSIYRLADYIVNHSEKLSFTPEGLSTSSENFTQQQRKIMETAFGCKVFDQYGSAESVVFASECEHGSMHIEPEYGILEVLTNNGDILAEGSGELVATTLLNDAMPLIRYRIGDLGTIMKSSCPCGRASRILRELHGKVGAVIVNGARQASTAAIAIAFEYLEGVKNAQITQNEPGKVNVKLVRRENFNPKSEEFMIWELHKMLGDSLQIIVDYVPEIPPEHNGKYQMVIQNYY
jgi:phenylacetate-CoA ligase